MAYILKEDGYALLKEDGSVILLEGLEGEEGKQLVVKVVTMSYRKVWAITSSYRIVKVATAAYRKIKAITLGE